MCFKRKKKGKSKVTSGGFCLGYSEVEQRALQFLHIFVARMSKNTAQLLL